MPAILAENSYGKSRVRLVRVKRGAERHEVRDLTVSIAFEGDFDQVHTAGDNSTVLPTDTMKNTVYALARTEGAETIEEFGIRLARHFLERNAPVSRVRIEVAEHPWSRIMVGSELHSHAFSSGGPEKSLARLTATRDGIRIQSGFDDLLIMKTTGSGFEGYVKDPFTTLKETSDRIFKTSVTALWSYGPAGAPFDLCREGVRSTLLETFARHDSRSVQHTLYAMGEAALAAFGELEEIRLSLPNRHCIAVDLTPFGLDHRNEIFVPVDEPYGLIEATLRRG
jgi:urate oxidase